MCSHGMSALWYLHNEQYSPNDSYSHAYIMSTMLLWTQVVSFNKKSTVSHLYTQWASPKTD